METTSHKPYVVFENGDTFPVLGFRENSYGTVPLIPVDEKIVEAQNWRDKQKQGQDYEIVVTKPNEKKILHG